MRHSAIVTLEPIAPPELPAAGFAVETPKHAIDSHRRSCDLGTSKTSSTFEDSLETATLRAHDAVAGAQRSEAQLAWAAVPLAGRLRVIGSARALLAERTELLTAAIAVTLARTPADTLAAEVLPLLAAYRFLEREAASILRPRRLGRDGRPFWLPGVTHLVERVPIGHVLVIAPGNYPLLLAGVQVLQALAAGNAVTWKPGRGGEPVARVMAQILADAGLPAGLLTVTGESAGEAVQAVTAGVDKIFLTGSAATGRAVLAQAAKTLTPCVVELSGCDSVVVFPDADITRVAKALSFGMRFNGSATCMAPRRVLLVGSGNARADSAHRDALLTQLEAALRDVPSVPIAAHTAALLRTLALDAERNGATIAGPGARALATAPAGPLLLEPVLLLNGTMAMAATRTDIFAPLLTVIDVPDTAAVLAAEAASPFALTCSIFGSERRANALAAQLRCGTVLINDLIVPTADPRLPFGGRCESGFGVSRGAEGLLEMTAVRVISTRRGRGTRHYEPTTNAHTHLFRALARSSYAGTWQSRFAGAREVLRAVRGLGERH